jgi:uncharacterized protein
MNYCLYHSKCYDGITAVYCIWKKYAQEKDSEWEFIAVAYQEPLPKMNINSESKLFIVDFSYSREILEFLHKCCPNLKVYDHHSTAEEALKGLEYCVFNNNESGGTLTWKQEFPNEKIPEIIEYTKDADLWKWEMSDSKAINEGLRAEIDLNDHFYINMEKFNDIVEQWHIVKYILRNKGEVIIDYKNKLIKEACLHVQKRDVVIEDKRYYIGVLNLGVYDILSDTGNTWLTDNEDVDFIAIYVVNLEKGNASVSLRGMDRIGRYTEGNIHCGNISKSLGGGGHANSSGFKVSINELSVILN